MDLSTSLLKLTIVSLFFVLCNAIPQVHAAQTIEGSIDDLSRALMTYFPKVSGKVSASKETEIEIDLEMGQGLSAGVLLTVFREGATFRHPVTSVPLGQFEGEVGSIEILNFESDHLSAKPIDLTKKIEVGDLVRLPSRKVTLGIAMVSDTDHPFLMNELSLALRGTGRFQVKPLPTGSDAETARQAGNDYYLTLTTSRQEEQFSVNLALQNTRTGKHLADLALRIRQSEKSGLILEHFQHQLFEQRLKK